MISEFPRQLTYFLYPGEERDNFKQLKKNLYTMIKGVISENRSHVNFIAINPEKGENHGEKEQYIPGRTVNHAE